MESCRKKQPLSRFYLWPAALPPGPSAEGGGPGPSLTAPQAWLGSHGRDSFPGPWACTSQGPVPTAPGPALKRPWRRACPGCPRFTRSCNGRMGRSVDGARFRSAAGQLVATRHVPAFPASPWLSDKGGMLALQLSSPLTIFAGGETQLLKIEIMRESRSF